MSSPPRLSKFLAHLGLCSRREADQLIEAGLVTVNQQRATLGYKVNENDEICLKLSELQDCKLLNKILTNQNLKQVQDLDVVYYSDLFDTANKEHIYVALNKAPGITCSCDPNIKGNIIDYLREIAPKQNFPRIYPVGRLDRESRGLILLTNDGDFALRHTHPKFEHPKEYEVTVDQNINEAFVQAMSTGVEIEVKGSRITTLPCTISKISKHKFSIILKQGYNRQIRKMCEELGYQVLDLKRVAFADIKLNKLGIAEGECKILDPQILR